MAKISEVARSINSFGKVGQRSNPIWEFAWVLRQTVQKDIVQVEFALGKKENLRYDAQYLMYAQRAIEMGYIFTEVFVRDEYKSWTPKSDSPRIIDLGGDPGAFSVLYWKQKAPNAQITVIEANPVTADVMSENLQRRGIEGVRVVNAAVAGDENDNATLHLHKPRKGWHTQDYIGLQGIPVSNEYTISVPKVKLSGIIREDERVDLLKMDIEGSESEVMRDLDASGKLKQIDQVVMEFHHDPAGNPDNSLIEMLDRLDQNEMKVVEAHITVGKGLRRKRNVPLDNIRNIASVNKRIFLTFNAVRKV